MTKTQLTVLTLLLTGFTAGCLLFLSIQVATAQTITCQLDTQPCPEELMSELIQALGNQSLIWFDHTATIQQIVANHSASIESVTKTLPDTIAIQLKSVDQLFQVQVGDQWLLIDAQGNQAFLDQPLELTTLSVPPEQIGDPALIQTLKKLIPALAEAELTFQEIIVQPNAIEVVLDSGTVALLPTEQPEYQVPRLALIQAELPNLELEPIQTIDLRFKNPVLKTTTDN